MTTLNIVQIQSKLELETSSPGALDFEMEKNSRKLIFQESCLKVPRVQHR